MRKNIIFGKDLVDNAGNKRLNYLLSRLENDITILLEIGMDNCVWF